MNLSPKQLDEQNVINISRWVDVHSEECRMIDDNLSLTKKWIRMGMEDPAFLFADSNGRIWGEGKEGRYYPFHLEHGKELIGLKLSAKASN